MPIATPTYPVPLLSSNSLPPSWELTPAIGSEFSSDVQLSSLLSSSSPSIKDLALLVSQRGVVFFRDQDLTTAQQKELVDRLGIETDRPKESSLHIHPLGSGNELGEAVPASGKEEVFKITADFNGATRDTFNQSSRASNIWHSDISFEPFPSDYAILKMNTLPKVGGDTLWASSYSAYDRLSPAMQQFLSTLTATHVGDTFHAPEGQKFREPRGHPENKGQNLRAVHPIVRTNPVTGWKGLYVNKFFTKRINELSLDESDNILGYLFEHIAQNHDLTCRFRWQPGSLAIWDNRSTLHSATNDYGSAAREGDRVVSVGERPYYDPNSISREASMQERAARNPDYAKAILKSYASGKLARGKGILEVGYKLDLIERELVAMRFPNFGKQIIEVRRELGLKESRIYVLNRSATTAAAASSSSATANVRRAGTTAAATTTAPAVPRAPVQRVANTDGAATPPPAYIRDDPNPEQSDLARAILASLTENVGRLSTSQEEGAPNGGAASNGRTSLDASRTEGATSNGRTSLEQPRTSTVAASSSSTNQYPAPSGPPPLPIRNSLAVHSNAFSSSAPPPPVKADDPLHLLTSYSTVFLIDDSTSMGENSLWEDTSAAVASVVPLAASFDPSGVEVMFLNSKVHAKCATELDLRELFQEVERPEGATPLGTRLEEVLLDYLGRLEREREREERDREERGDGVSMDGGSSNELGEEKLMPLNVIIITDGATLKRSSRPRNNPFLDPDSVPSDDPESVIVAACKRLDRGNWPLSQLGINFVQVGSDPEAREYLQELDDGLSTSHGGIRDIVDTVPWSSEGGMQRDGKLLRKILLGGVNRRIDRRA